MRRLQRLPAKQKHALGRVWTLDEDSFQSCDDRIMNHSATGNRSRPFALLLATGLAALACGPTMPQLRTKAAADFDCPKEAVKLATVDSDTMYVSCYEQEATYSSTCEGEEGCRWIKDEKLDEGATKENY